MNRLLTLLSFLVCTQLLSQEIKPIKTYTATKIDQQPKIDGVLDDDVWATIPELGNFVMLEPENGTPEKETHKTKIKLAYNNEAVFVAAYMYDNEPDKILRQFSQRDNLRTQADFIGVIFNTYNNQINETKFLVTSAGTLADATSENGRDDWSWSTVFRAEVSFDDKGWYAEFKIPYAALRFPNQPEQLWGLQFFRQIKHLNLTYSWSYVDRSNGFESQYVGLLKGIKGIKPPTRLSFYPFTSVNHERFDGENETTFAAGMDIKYGISDSFTLDATLIPDFGQAKFDDVSLNLGPFEQIFSENRQFFTEGVELFNKGRLFYSRRIGGAPSASGNAYDDLADEEEVLENPSDVKILNSIKLSGRTKDGLGIGVLNSITQKTEAEVFNNTTGQIRKVETEPLANYNVLVLDQQFGNNSSISLINTNVLRSGHYRDANVTAVAFDINNKKNSFNFSGQGTVNQINDINGNQQGFAQRFSINRIKGRFRYGIWNSLANKGYNINDLGISREFNFNNYGARISYENFEPTKRYNKYRFNLRYSQDRRLLPNTFVRQGLNFNVFAATINRLSYGSGLWLNSKFKDYYEPRVEERFFERDGNYGGNVWISTDFRKKFAIEANVSHTRFFNTPQRGLFLRVEPRYRFSDNFSLILELERWNGDNQLGYVNTQGDDIIIAQRDQMNLEGNLTASYNFDSRQAINLSFRSFWSKANYRDNTYFSLNNDGSLTQINYDTASNNHNIDYNRWNIDLTYNWRFAPGSEAILLYRQQIFNQGDDANVNLGESYNNLFKQPIKHVLSLKVVYFLDYNNLKNMLKKSES